MQCNCDHMTMEDVSFLKLMMYLCVLTKKHDSSKQLKSLSAFSELYTMQQNIIDCLEANSIFS